MGRNIIGAFRDFISKVGGHKYDLNNLSDIEVGDYYSTDSKSVEAFEDVLSFMCEDIKRSIRLTSVMKKQLTEEFGKHLKTFRGEFFYYIWSLNFEGENFIIYTANRKGTSIYISNCEFSDDKSQVIIRFLSKLDEMLLKKES